MGSQNHNTNRELLLWDKNAVLAGNFSCSMKVDLLGGVGEADLCGRGHPMSSHSFYL